MADRYFTGVRYPASKADVIAQAEQEGAPQELLDALQKASTEQFGSVGEVRDAVSRAAQSSQ